MRRDITARKQSEEERQRLHAQLLQAQKMEAIGNLARGIAHDFNNMLSVIFGHVELASSRVDPSEPIYHHLQQIVEAGMRSADITRQLLAYARKQNIRPQVLDLNSAVEKSLKMLRRLIGEDIDLLWKPATRLRAVKMDPAQMDQILANLCVNARDAIATVGKVTVETGMVTFDQAYCATHTGFVPGDFVLLAVSDDGCGEDTILSMFKTMLESLGYTTLAVAKPSEATRLAKTHEGRIHMLITDLIMPEMNGRDLARQLKTLHPNLKLLFTSGYTANVIVHQGVLDDDVQFIFHKMPRHQG